MCDIEDIEPLHGTRFVLNYMAAPLGSNLPILGKIAIKQPKLKREEEFISKHIAELTDAFDQIRELMEKQEKKLEEMMSSEGDDDASSQSRGEESEDSSE